MLGKIDKTDQLLWEKSNLVQAIREGDDNLILFYLNRVLTLVFGVLPVDVHNRINYFFANYVKIPKENRTDKDILWALNIVDKINFGYTDERDMYLSIAKFYESHQLKEFDF